MKPIESSTSATQGALHHLSIGCCFCRCTNWYFLPSPRRGLASEILSVFKHRTRTALPLMNQTNQLWDPIFQSKPLRQKPLGVLYQSTCQTQMLCDQDARNRGSVICQMICYILSSVWITISQWESYCLHVTVILLPLCNTVYPFLKQLLQLCFEWDCKAPHLLGHQPFQHSWY